MERENLFLLMLGIAAAGYALYEGIFLLWEYARTSPAEASVCEVREEGRAKWLRKYAILRYMTKQGMRESENMIPISLGAYMGMKRKIRYFVEQPRIVSAHSVRHLLWGTVIPLVFFCLSLLV